MLRARRRCVGGAVLLVTAVFFPFGEFLGGVGDVGVGLFELMQRAHELEEAIEVEAFVAVEEEEAVLRIL